MSVHQRLTMRFCQRTTEQEEEHKLFCTCEPGQRARVCTQACNLDMTDLASPVSMAAEEKEV